MTTYGTTTKPFRASLENPLSQQFISIVDNLNGTAYLTLANMPSLSATTIESVESAKLPLFQSGVIPKSTQVSDSNQASTEQAPELPVRRLRRVVGSVSSARANTSKEEADTSIVIEPSKDGLPAIVLACAPAPRPGNPRCYKRPPCPFQLPPDSLFGSVADRGQRGGRAGWPTLREERHSGEIETLQRTSNPASVQRTCRRNHVVAPRPQLVDVTIGPACNTHAHTVPSRAQNRKYQSTTTFDDELTLAFLAALYEKERQSGHRKKANQPDKGSGRWSWAGNALKRSLSKMRMVISRSPI